MKADSRALIINAASRLFSEHGYEKTSMADIGALIGMNKASIYYHFRDKQALFGAMVEGKRQPHRAATESLLARLPVGPERVIAFLRAEIDFAASLSLNFFEPAKPGAGHETTAPVFASIVAEDAKRLTKLLAEWPALNQNRANPETLAANVLRVAQGLLLTDCPFDLPLAERPEAYGRIKDRMEEIVALMLKGAS